MGKQYKQAVNQSRINVIKEVNNGELCEYGMV